VLSATAEVLLISRDDIQRVLGRDGKDAMRHLAESLSASTTVLREHGRQERRKALELVRTVLT
jgi:hypothetical protein